MSKNTACVPTAAAKVFAIPELLGHVLDYIANHVSFLGQEYCGIHAQQIKALVRLQRVNMTFRNTIRKSRACPRAMFLEHTYSGRCEHEKKFSARLNPLVLEILSLKDIDHEVFSFDNELNYFVHTPETPQALLTCRNRLEAGLLNLPRGNNGSWKEALVCNMPAKVEFFLVTNGRIGTSVRVDRARPISTLGQMVALFEAEIGDRLKLFELEMRTACGES